MLLTLSNKFYLKLCIRETSYLKVKKKNRGHNEVNKALCSIFFNY